MLVNASSTALCDFSGVKFRAKRELRVTVEAPFASAMAGPRGGRDFSPFNGDDRYKWRFARFLP